MNIITALTSPINAVADKLMIEVAVRVFRTLSSNRCTPPEKTFSSRASA